MLDLELRLKRSVNLVSNAFTSVHLKLVAITNLTSTAERFLVLTSFHEEFLEGKDTGLHPEIVNLRHYHDVSVLVADTRFRIMAKHVLSEKLTLDPGLDALLLNMDSDSLPEIVTLSSAESPRVLKYRPREQLAYDRRD